MKNGDLQEDKTVQMSDGDITKTESDKSTEDIKFDSAKTVNLNDYYSEQNFFSIDYEEDEKPFVTWEAPVFSGDEIPAYARFVIFGVLAAIEIYAGITQNITTFFVILALALLVFVYSRSIPEIVEQEICPSYIKIDGKKIPYDEIDRFWIVYNEKEQEVSFALKSSKKAMLPVVRSHLGSLSPNFLRDVLRDKIEEVAPEPKGIFDIIMKFLHL